MYDSDKVWIVDWHGKRRKMTPDNLLRRIKLDSESNWNWLASATEIVLAISDPDFPEPIANELKGIILNCFAELLLGYETGRRLRTDNIAVAYCYYSIHGESGEQIKSLYRENLLRAVTRHSCLERAIFGGKEWDAFRNSWEKDALQHFTERFGADFMRFEFNAVTDFKKSVKRADEAGEFDNDKKALFSNFRIRI